MSNFNLERAVSEWRAQLLSRGGYEAGDLAELESGLHDRYEEYLLKGLPPNEAFTRARAHLMPTFGAALSATDGTSSTWRLLPGYVRVAVRNFRKRIGYSLTNFACLSLGILTAALTLLYLNYETTYDASIPEVEQKYRLAMNLRSQGYSMRSFQDFFGTDASTQRNEIEQTAAVTGVRQAVQLMDFSGPQRVEANEKRLPTENLLQTNTPGAFADFFGWEFLLGSAAGFAAAPQTALLTATQAERFFGSDWRSGPLLGERLRIDTTDYTISGVIADPAPNLHLTFTIALHTPRIDYWGARQYVELDPGATPESVAAGIDANLVSINPRLAEDELYGGTIIQPLRSIHLGSDLLYEMRPPGKPQYLYLIGIIALLILVLTVVNYTNLTVAMSAGRAREIGMRKVFGASDSQVSLQFLLEAVVLSWASVPLVMGCLHFLVPRFNRLMGIALPENVLGSPGIWGALLGIATVVGLLASLYPAVFLARKTTLPLLKGLALKGAGRGLNGRKVMITAQFVLLIGLCSMALFVNRQLVFIQEKDLGFDREQVLYVSLNGDSTRFATFRNEALRLPEVTEVGSGTLLGQQPFNQTTYKLAGTEEVFDDATNVYFDYRSLALLGVETSVPDYLAAPDQAPARMILINGTLADRLTNRFGVSRKELIGQTLIQEPEYTNEETGEVGFPYEIGGFFEDINLFSLRSEVNPMFLTVFQEPRYTYWAAVAYRGDTPSGIVEKVRGVYEGLGTQELFTHTFLDDNLAELYVEEQRMGTLTTVFSGVAFLTAVIGLIAFTAYLTRMRRREIGICKVLGAETWQILRRFNGEYLPLLGLAFVIAVPLAWWGVSLWLRDFAYRIPIVPTWFIVAGLATLIVTVLAVSAVTLRAARRIPARVL